MQYHSPVTVTAAVATELFYSINIYSFLFVVCFFPTCVVSLMAEHLFSGQNNIAEFS